MLALLQRRGVQLGFQNARALHTSSKRFPNQPTITMMPPLPPPEFEADGAPRKYPLWQSINEHGYTWEHWTLEPHGVFHTAYWADLAQDSSPFMAWVQSYSLMVMFPAVITVMMLVANVQLKWNKIGIKPKRYTPEWICATKERERVENTNPVSRYLDRRYAERGHHVPLGEIMPHHDYFLWMSGSHDHEYREERGWPDLRDDE